MIYEATVRDSGDTYHARIGGCTASATSSAETAVKRAAAKALHHENFTVRRKSRDGLQGKCWKETWEVIEGAKE